MRPGDLLGRYTVRAFVGAGSMGEVFAAYDPALDRIVALKVLKPKVNRAAHQAFTRFQREAQAMARLSHPNVVSVFDCDIVGDRVFLAMELVEGPTLAEWIAVERRGWREIASVFLQAGRGLEAAHAAGIIHRDFKPSNVIVGDRVRVADFGLARGALEPDADVPGSGSVLETDITATGARLGTFAYMAPEVLAGQPATEASDQYSFAKAFTRALSGGENGEPAAPRNVPSWVRVVASRALATRPEDRHASMSALLAELERHPLRARRRGLIAVAALAVISAAALAFRAGRQQTQSAMCDGGAALAGEVWNEASRARVRQAFVATGRPYAAETFGRIDAILGTRLVEWARAHRDSCEATQVRHEQSEALLDLRMQCLKRVRGDAVTLVGLLTEANGEVVDRAVSAVASVADTTPCSDWAALTSVVPPPHDDQARRTDSDLRDEAGRIAALTKLGRIAEAVAASQALVPRARAAGRAPALAVTLMAAAAAQTAARDYDAAIATGYEAARAAEEAHDDDIRAEALARLAFLLGYYKESFDEAKPLLRLAEAAAIRAGQKPRLMLTLMQAESSTLYMHSDLVAGLPLAIAELGFAIRDGGWPSTSVSLALRDLVDFELAFGNYAVARRLAVQSRIVAEAVLGPAHPGVATAYAYEARAARRLDDVEGAAAGFLHALRIREAAFGPDHSTVASTLLRLAHLRLDQQRLDEASELADRASQIFNRVGSAPAEPIETDYLRGIVLHLQGRFRDSLALAERRRADCASLYGSADVHTAHFDALMGANLQRLGRLGDARASYERAIASYLKISSNHPDAGAIMCNLAGVLAAEGHARKGVETCERGLGFLEKAHGPEHRDVIDSRVQLAAALIDAGDSARAKSIASRADEIAAMRELPAPIRVAARFQHARSLTRSDSPRACALAREARATAASVPHSNEMPDIERWLDRHCAQ